MRSRGASSMGIIPAYAGSTLSVESARIAAKDHPRVCGEHLRASSTAFLALGSSPRMRGAQCSCDCGNVITGIIPAYAGSTSASRECRIALWDHPRVCGEHGDGFREACQVLGSSPRMRGARGLRGLNYHVTGIIPAYAGSTCPLRRRISRRRDHPRVCGEHLWAVAALALAVGSSPRMRGALRRGVKSFGRTGIIPAYAGSTLVMDGSANLRRDHPRVCGEHHAGAGASQPVTGSSPRMRGARQTGSVDVVPKGIIPAYAGSTTLQTLRLTFRWDHPRVCGEHQTSQMRTIVQLGSSPRMRGARISHDSVFLPSGIIPAYAGSTPCR